MYKARLPTPDWVAALPIGLAAKLAFENGVARARAGLRREPCPYLSPDLRNHFERGFSLEKQRRVQCR